MRQRLSLSEILIQSRLLEETGLRAARAEQARRGGSLPACLVRLGCVSERDLVLTLSRSLGIPALAIRGRGVHPDILELVPGELAEKYGCLPLFTRREDDAEVLYLGVEDPTDLSVVDEVSFRVGRRVRPVVVGPAELRAALRHAYPGPSSEPAPLPPAAEGAPPAADTEPMLEEPPQAHPQKAVSPLREAELPTRDILRALTRLLIAKGVFTRAEFMEAVAGLRDGRQDAREGDED